MREVYGLWHHWLVSPAERDLLREVLASTYRSIY